MDGYSQVGLCDAESCHTVLQRVGSTSALVTAFCRRKYKFPEPRSKRCGHDGGVVPRDEGVPSVFPDS